MVLVLAECRIEPAFGWGLIVCSSFICMLPLRTALPASAALLAVYLLNRLGWSQLSSWDAGDWFSAFFNFAPFIALMLFFGRIAATSAERGKLIAELQAAKQALELARERELELAALRERERLARDLHDTLGHALVTLTVQLEAAQRLQSADPARVTTAADGITEAHPLQYGRFAPVAGQLAHAWAGRPSADRGIASPVRGSGQAFRGGC